MKKIAYTVLFVLVMFSCQNDDGIIIPQGSEEIDLTINFVGLNLQTSGLSGKSAKNSTSQKISDWVHIFQADLNIEFTNKETLKVFKMAYNPATPAAGYKIILPFGVYDYKLESLGETYANYIPFKASGIIEINKQAVTLNLVGVTTYGLITVDKFHITSVVLQDAQLGVIQMASSQEHFYKYVLSQKTPLVKITEDLLNTQPTYQLPSIVALVRYNLMLGVNELSVISFILSDFQQEDFYVDIDQNAARTYVPDDNFEQALIDLGYDNVLDDYVLTNNIVGVENVELLVGSYGVIDDLTGIEVFTALKVLSFWSENLTTLNLSGNLLLEKFETFSPKLNSFNVDQNAQLKELKFLEYNELTSLNISNNTLLTNLLLSLTPLTSIDISQNILLENLLISASELTSIDISQNTLLTNLDVSGNTSLTCIKVNQTQLDVIPSNWSKDAGASYSLNCN